MRSHLALLTVFLTLPIAAATLTGETSKPTHSVFVRGEAITLTFRVEGLAAGQPGLTLAVVQTDADGGPVGNTTLKVVADEQGQWQGTVAGRSDRLGFVRVTAVLSTGETLPAVGSRSEGQLTYLVVTDPTSRVRPGDAGRFGLQGGWTTAADQRELLGVNWVLGEYSWGWSEPDRPGQLMEKRANPDPMAVAQRELDRKLNVMPVFCLIGGGGIPKYAQQMKDGQPVKGVVGDLKAFGDYCREVGTAATADYAHLPKHYYQVTWEPVYPWGFEGTDEDLIRIYEAAYPALHATDPKAVVIGPTGAGISAGDLAWNERLLRKGIGKVLDAFCIHPYIAQPPEEHHLVQNVRALKEIIRTCAGKDLEIIGTEQGSATDAPRTLAAAQDRERQQAMWLVRSAIIDVGEGMKCNFSFYACDYPGEPGYGFFHNLVLDKQPWGPGVVSPKPIAGSYAAMTMLLEGHQTVGPVEGLGPTTLGYAFERAGRVTLALWDTGPDPRAVKLPVGQGQIGVFDWMGNARPLAPTGGVLALTLGPTVQYVRGVDPALWGSKATRPIVLKANTLAVLAGDAVSLQATLTPPRGIAGAATLTVSGGAEMGLPDVTQRVTVKAGQATPVTVPLALPPTARAGTMQLRLTVQTGEQAWGTTSAIVRVSEPLAIESLRPLGGQRLGVRLVNRRAQPATGQVNVRLRGVPDGRASAPFSLTAKQTTDVTLAFPAAVLEPGRNATVEVTATPQGGVPVTRTERLAFTDITKAPALTVDGDLSDWSGRAMALRGRAMMVRQPQLYRGLDDLDATVQLAWDDKGLYLAATVRDDKPVQTNTGFDTWKGDCLQVAIDTAPGRAGEATGNVLADTASRGNTELDLALTPQGPQAYRTVTFDPAKLPVALLDPKAVPMAIRRTAGVTTYEAQLPWAALGRSALPPAGKEIGFAITVNDMDAPEQLDPKALGLFGGICPVKDPAQFGRLVLDDRASRDILDRPVGGPGSPAPRVLGQSQPPDAAPLPFTGCAGVARQDNGDLWAVAGDQAYHLDPAGKLLEALPLPTGFRLARADAGRLVCLAHEGVFYEFSLATKAARQLCDARLDGQGPSEFCVGRAGEIIAVYRTGLVRQWRPDGTQPTDRFRLAPGKDWDYRAIGCDPQTGDVWVGSYWPDCKLHRFAPDDTQPRETREGHAAVICTVGKGLWWFDTAGVAQALSGSPAGRATRPPVGNFTYYPTGAAAGPSDAWVACAQGLVQFDAQGQPTGRRVGGLGDPGLVAVDATGSVLALVENSQRFTRMWADDEANAALASQANEPWRVAAGWQGKALGLAWMGDGYAVLDAATQALWRFDPDHVAWAEKPWIRLTQEGMLTAPRLLACGPARTFVLDGDRLLAFWTADFSQPPTAIALPPTLKPAALVALAVTEDEMQLLVATATTVTAFALDGSMAWEATGFQQVAGLSSSGRQALVADSKAGTVTSLGPANGERTPVLDGLEPTGLATMGPWLFVSDAKGHRVVRCRLAP